MAKMIGNCFHLHAVLQGKSGAGARQIMEPHFRQRHRRKESRGKPPPFALREGNALCRYADVRCDTISRLKH